MQNTIILLIEQIVVALGGEFKLYLPQLIPHMLRVFMHDSSPGRSVTIKVNTELMRAEKWIINVQDIRSPQTGLDMLK